MLHSAIFHVGLMGIPDVLLNFYFVASSAMTRRLPSCNPSHASAGC